MTPSEYKSILDKMTKDQFDAHRGKLNGGHYMDREQAYNDFVKNPELERFLCSVLDTQMESQKILHVAIDSCEVARASASAAKLSATTSLVIAICAIAALTIDSCKNTTQTTSQKISHPIIKSDSNSTSQP